MSKNNSLIDKLISSSDSPFIKPLESSMIYIEEELCDVEVPMLNIALSGKVNGGLESGVTMIAGESKRFKTLFGLIMMSKFLKKYKNAVAIIYDTEFGSQKKYFDMVDLDTSRVIHIPITCVENLKTEVVKQLDTLTKIKEDSKGKDITKVFMFIDSIGNMASRKEINDAIAGKEVADMTRAKQLKSFFRIVTSTVKLLNIPLVCINHTYKDQGSFIPSDVVSGGQGAYLAANTIFIVGRKQSKESNELKGYDFIINIEKSRKVREKSKLPITVYFEDGIHTYSGLADLAVELGIIEEIKIGKSIGYKWNDIEIKSKQIDVDKAFWDRIFNETNFNQLISEKFEIGGSK
jgi:hypothetical protein